ncbi:hypothetical protein Patl1_12012 [Pistacia atlantica]|uniref:Uncharacterized protein n=1 Tax=Pistacia atlantica TaxID=434234 RepID=A0ACC1A4P8_9ROSI|nr:hypothetical protein Patl1_12012 [Pistacia atlantica]
MENSWTGILSEAHMMKLGRLEYVRITTEPTRFKVNLPLLALEMLESRTLFQGTGFQNYLLKSPI